MADLNIQEKRALETMLGMSSGYVLQFSNRTFAEFFADSVGIDIYDEKYAVNGDSKACRLRAFWSVEPNAIVGRLLHDMIEYIVDLPSQPTDPSLRQRCVKITQRLLEEAGSFSGLDALTPVTPERSSILLVASIRDSIEAGQPEAALDRLHTHVVKYIRHVCRKRGLDASETVPLHGLMGEYTKRLKSSGAIECDLAERILKGSIATMEYYNHVRNRQSLAHDNPVLSRSESLLILNHVTSTIRFIQEIEGDGLAADGTLGAEQANRVR